MSNATIQDLIKLEEHIDKRFDELITTLSTFADNVDRRFNEHDEEFRKLNQKYDHLVNTIDGFVGRIDKYETELAARDHKIDRLERWIEQLAKTTGVKLT